MAFVKVDESNWGLSAARSRMEKVVDPPGTAIAWSKFFPSFAQDVRNGNQLIDEVQALKEMLARRPF